MVIYSDNVMKVKLVIYYNIDNGKISKRGNHKNDEPIKYNEYHRYKLTKYYIR